MRDSEGAIPLARRFFRLLRFCSSDMFFSFALGCSSYEFRGYPPLVGSRTDYRDGLNKADGFPVVGRPSRIEVLSTLGFSFRFAFCFRFGFAFCFRFALGFAFAFCFSFSFGFALGFRFAFCFSFSFGFAFCFRFSFSFALGFRFTFCFRFGLSFSFALGFSFRFALGLGFSFALSLGFPFAFGLTLGHHIVAGFGVRGIRIDGVNASNRTQGKHHGGGVRHAFGETVFQ